MSGTAFQDDLVAQLRDAAPAQLDAVVSALLLAVRDQPPADAIDQLRKWRDRFEVCRSELIADAQDSGVEGPALDALIGRQTTTRSDRRRAKRRADTIRRNSDLSGEIENGRLTAEQLDAIADADARTDGRAATDAAFLADISASPADAARKHADEFVKAQLSDDDLDKRRRAQRKQRGVRRGKTADGLASLTISGDDESVHQMWSSIVDTADSYYRADGGRETAAGKHPRTDAQRLFDAAHHHLTSSGAVGGAVRPIVVVTATRLAGSPDAPPAEMIGTGPIPDCLLEEIACGSDFVGMLFDRRGEVLWQGRNRRYPTRAQQLALIARDRGCVLCGADPQRCEAHHLMPWSAPGQGRTDIDGLALLCGTCHRALHERNHTLYRDCSDGRWQTRPATPHETPRRRPTTRTRSPGSANTGQTAALGDKHAKRVA